MFKGSGAPFPVIRSGSNITQIFFLVLGTILESVAKEIQKSKIRATLIVHLSDCSGLERIK